ncbi:hypothetical protein MC885_000818 [Smutsia gigantea]|nr:hypothetical protein MC885_000818 [Smutsia gigantea]
MHNFRPKVYGYQMYTGNHIFGEE